MWDVLYLAIAIAFFALTWGLVHLIGRLESAEQGERRP